MSTTAYRNNPSSRSFTRQHIRTSSTTTAATDPTATNGILPSMTNDRSRYPFPNNRKLQSSSFVRESLSSRLSTTTITALPPPLPLPSVSVSSAHSTSSQLNETSKQPYMYSNPPRELQRQSIQTMKYLRNNRSRQRVSSAPDENSFQISPRSVLNQQKPSSANESSTPRSNHDKGQPPSSVSMNHLFKRNEQEKNSLNDLIRKQERSRVPKAVQKRRIILLFRRLPGSTPPLVSPRQQYNASPIRPDMPLIDVSQVQSPIERRRIDEEPFHQRSKRSFVPRKRKYSLIALFQHLPCRIPRRTIHSTALIRLRSLIRNSWQRSWPTSNHWTIGFHVQTTTGHRLAENWKASTRRNTNTSRRILWTRQRSNSHRERWSPTKNSPLVLVSLKTIAMRCSPVQMPKFLRWWLRSSPRTTTRWVQRRAVRKRSPLDWIPAWQWKSKTRSMRSNRCHRPATVSKFNCVSMKYLNVSTIQIRALTTNWHQRKALPKERHLACSYSTYVRPLIVVFQFP